MPELENDIEATKPPTPAPTKRKSVSIDTAEVVEKVLSWYDQDLRDRSDWSERRLQRYAKYRGWLENKDYPWPDASNAYIPLMMTDSQQMQDTLHNGVMSQRPVMSPQAVNPADKDKADQIADLLDYQFFVEQKGERKLSTLIESFVNDGTLYAMQAWVKDQQDVEQVHLFPPLQDGLLINYQLRQIIEGLFSDQRGVTIELKDESDPFVWEVEWTDENTQPHEAKVEFYTYEDGRLECIVKRKKVIFEGPQVLPLSEEDIVYPSRAENLQPPSPSNPKGAHHVFVVDTPMVDEIKRLRKSGYYDLITDEQMALMDADTQRHTGGTGSADDPEQHKIQRDLLAGQFYGNSDMASSTYTRLKCFARWDIDGDGLDENVVFWVLKEHRVLLKACLQQEIFPNESGCRPLVSEQFIPVPGQIRGIGLLELLEHIQDLMKVLVDQTIDKNTLVNSPFFFFRATSGVRPEVIRMAPGEGYPVANPQQDIAWSQLPNADQTVSLNLLAIFNQWAERQAVIGELQFGRVPQGKASALRTTQGMMAVLQSGAARPERIIRRFFMGLAEIWSQMHELNGVFLNRKKQYRILGMSTPGSDPYVTVDDPSKIKGQFQFEFKANSLNTNKAIKGQILQQLGAMTFNPLMMQMGLVTPENIYQWLKDVYNEAGQDPNKYLTPPSPASAKPKITAEQAMGLLYRGVIPDQLPSEGPQVHVQNLQALYQQAQRERLVDPAFQVLYQIYTQKVQGYALQAMQAQQAAAQFAAMMQGGGGGSMGGGGGESGGGQMMPQPQGQLMDESLPTAGGGAHGAF